MRSDDDAMDPRVGHGGLHGRHRAGADAGAQATASAPPVARDLHEETQRIGP